MMRTNRCTWTKTYLSDGQSALSSLVPAKRTPIGSSIGLLPADPIIDMHIFLWSLTDPSRIEDKPRLHAIALLRIQFLLAEKAAYR
jgi:hypothetical protein